MVIVDKYGTMCRQRDALMTVMLHNRSPSHIRRPVRAGHRSNIGVSETWRFCGAVRRPPPHAPERRNPTITFVSLVQRSCWASNVPFQAAPRLSARATTPVSYAARDNCFVTCRGRLQGSFSFSPLSVGGSFIRERDLPETVRVRHFCSEVARRHSRQPPPYAPKIRNRSRPKKGILSQALAISQRSAREARNALCAMGFSVVKRYETLDTHRRLCHNRDERTLRARRQIKPF